MGGATVKDQLAFLLNMCGKIIIDEKKNITHNIGQISSKSLYKNLGNTDVFLGLSAIIFLIYIFVSKRS